VKGAHFAQLFRFVHLLAWVQRAARWSLRAVWVGAGIYLSAWGLHELIGWLPDRSTWLYLALAGGGVLLLGAFLPWPRAGRLSWNLDRHYGFKEQVSAALATEHLPSSNPLAGLLAEDAAGLLSAKTARIARRGWFITRDLLSAAIVFSLAWLAFRTELSAPALVIDPPRRAHLPALGEDPAFEQVFPSGTPGLEATNPPAPDGEAGSSSGPGNVAGDLAGNEGSSLAEQLNNLQGLMKKLGEGLAQEIVTQEIGESLQRGDLQSAAGGMEQLSEQLGQVSQESKNRIAETLSDGAQQAAQVGADPLAQALNETAESLQSGDDSASGQNLAQMADFLRQFDELMASLAQSLAELSEGQEASDIPSSAGGGAGAGTTAAERETSRPEPFARLEGEAGVLELGGDEDQSGLLNPGQPQMKPGTATVQGSVDSLITVESGSASNPLVPFHYAWNWRDVVSSYFTPR
jgi:hypothetical protein